MRMILPESRFAFFGIMRPHARDVTQSGQLMFWNRLNAAKIALKWAVAAASSAAQESGGIRQQRGGRPVAALRRGLGYA
jgi:hypothetical protein